MVYMMGEGRIMEWTNPTLPVLPSLCSVCAQSGSMNIVPDRDNDTFGRYAYCVLCIDAFCSLFPLHPNKILSRQYTGKWNNHLKKPEKKLNNF